QQLEQGLVELLPRHDALRMAFRKGDELGHYVPAESLQVLTVETVNTQEGANHCIDHCQRSLNIKLGRMIQACLLLREDSEQNQLLIVIHHLVVDGVSWRVLARDFLALLQQLNAGESKLHLPEKAH